MARFDLFISYSTKDSKFVEKLATTLRGSGFSVWLDRWEIKAGDRLRDRILAGIASSRYFCVILTHNSINAPWVQQELNDAMLKELDSREIVVVPVLYGKVSFEELSSDLRAKLCLDFRKTSQFSKGVDAIRARLGAPPYTYKVIRGTNVLDILSEDGTSVNIKRTTRISSLISGLNAVPDEFFTDGKIEDLDVYPGEIIAKRLTLGKLEIISSLGVSLNFGEEFTQNIEYKMIDSFCNDEEYWLGWTATPCDHYEYSIIFPALRPPTSFGHRRKVGTAYLDIGHEVTLDTFHGRPRLTCVLDEQPVGQFDQVFWKW